MPIRIGSRNLASCIELRDLLDRQIPAYGTEVLFQLLFIASTNDDGRDGRPLEQPVQPNLRDSLAGVLRHGIERIDNLVQILVRHRWTIAGRLRETAYFRQRLAASNLSRQAAPAQRAPDEGSYTLVQAERHEFPFVIAADQGIINLM